MKYPDKYWRNSGILIVVHIVIALYFGLVRAADDIDYMRAGSDLFGFWNSTHVIRTPGYPALVALLGSNFPLVIFMQHAMVIGIAWMAYQIVEPVDPRAAWISFWLVGLHPWIAIWASAIMTEISATFCLVLALFLLIKKHPLWAGFLIGYAILIRPASIGALPALLFGAYLFTREKRVMASACLMCLLTLTPWLFRNYSNAGMVGISAAGGMNIWQRYAVLDGISKEHWPIINKIIAEKGELEGNRYMMQEGLRIMKQHPVGVCIETLRMTKAFFAYDLQTLIPSIHEEWSKSIRQNTMGVMSLKILFQYLLPLIALSFAFYGAYKTYRHPNMSLVLVMLLGLIAVVILTGMPDTRLRIPAEPMFVMFISVGLSAIFRKWE